MIKVEFCADTVAQLKSQIFAYAEAMTPPVDHTTRILPEQTAVTQAKVAKAAKEKPTPKVEPPKVDAPPPPADVKPPEVPSDAVVQAALVAVNDKHGIDKAIECLTKFGVKRGRELTDAQKADFVTLCKSVM